MKALIYLLFLCPLWAAIATWLALQIFISCIACLIFMIGLARGLVSRKNNAVGFGMMVIQVVIFASIFWVARWFFGSVLSVCETRGEKIIFWGIAILFGLVYMKEVLSKIKRNWDFAHIPGTIEEYTWARKMGLVK